VPLTCSECEVEADECARGWLAYLVDLPDDEDEVELIAFCPMCAAREFGRGVRRVGGG